MVGFEVAAAPVLWLLSLVALVVYCAFQEKRGRLLGAAFAGALVGGLAAFALLAMNDAGGDVSVLPAVLMIMAGGVLLGAYVAVGIVVMAVGSAEAQRAARWGALLAVAGALLLLELARRRSPAVGSLETSALRWLYPPLLLFAGGLGSLIGAQVANVRAWTPQRRNRLLIRLAVAAAVFVLGFHYAHARHRAAELNYMSQSHDVRGLARLLRSGSRGDRYAAACLLRNARLGEYPQAVLSLLQAQQDRDAKVRQAATGTLEKFGQAQVQDAVAQAARQGDAEVRYEAMLILGGVKDNDVAVPTLMMALHDPDPRVRWAAQKGLNRRGMMPAPSATPPAAPAPRPPPQMRPGSPGPGSSTRFVPAADRPLREAAQAKRQGDLKRAESLYREAIRLDRGRVESHRGLAWVLAEQGRKSEAITEFREVLTRTRDAGLRKEAEEAIGRLSR